MTHIEVEDWICKTLCNGTGCPVVNVMARYREVVDTGGRADIQDLKKWCKESGLFIRRSYYNHELDRLTTTGVRRSLVVADCRRMCNGETSKRPNCGSVFARMRQDIPDRTLTAHEEGVIAAIHARWVINNRLR